MTQEGIDPTEHRHRVGLMQVDDRGRVWAAGGVIRLTAAGTAKPVRLTRVFQRRFALRLGAELLKKCRQR